MQPISRIVDSERHLWCPSFVETSGRLWMFASAWPKNEGFDGWRAHSRIVVIEIDPSSYSPIGKFRTIEPLGEGRRLHNPKVMCNHNEAFLVFSENLSGGQYKIGGARLSLTEWAVLESCEDLVQSASKHEERNGSQGPTNPAVYRLADGLFGMVGREAQTIGSVRHLYFAVADDFMGPWSDFTRIELGNGDDLEDPCVWSDKKGFHMLVRDIGGTVSGVTWPSIARLHSEDGVIWAPATKAHIFNRTLPGDEGTPTLFFRTERPSVFAFGGKTKISFAALTGKDAVSHIRVYDWSDESAYLEKPANEVKPKPAVTEKSIPVDLPLIERIQSHHLTYLRPARLQSLETEMDRLSDNGQPGLVVEFGVALGGSGSLMAAKLPRAMKFIGYDVFGQIPPPDENDSQRSHERYAIIDAGESKGLQGETYYGYREKLMDEVKANFAAIGAPVDGDRVRLVKGLFRDTVSFPEGTVIRLAHIDCDWYDPTMFCLNSIEPCIPKWGTIVIDDFDDWEGCRRATHEWLAANPDFRLREVQPHAIIRRFEVSG